LLNGAATAAISALSLHDALPILPSGWSLSAGSDQGGGVWTEAVADLGSLSIVAPAGTEDTVVALAVTATATEAGAVGSATTSTRSEEHTSELQSRGHLVSRHLPT